MTGPRRWNPPLAWTTRGARGDYKYAVGWDRLATYEDLVLRQRPAGRMTAVNLYLQEGFWNAELRLMERRGQVAVIISRYSSSVAREAGPGEVSVRRYLPAEEVHLHVKADLWEDAGDPLFRVTTAHLASRRLGPLVLGMRGLGRSELFVQTTHPGVLDEARALVRCLEANQIPVSGRYLRVEGPGQDDIYEAICDDLARLPPGVGRILHARANFHGMWKPASQNLNGLTLLHGLLQARARAGTDVTVAYGQPTAPALAQLRLSAQAGARVGVPRYVPGSFVLPYRLTPLVQRVPWFREFKLADHFNVTVIDGLRDPASDAPYSVTYVGNKGDLPYDAKTLELMLRCDSREFPGLADGITSLVESRLSLSRGDEFLRDRRGPPIAP